MDNKLKGYFPVIFITVVVLIAVSLLAGIDSVTAEKISSQEAQKKQTMLAEMFVGMDDLTPEELSDPVDGIFVIRSGEEVVGYAFEAKGKGYGGDINLLVGLESDKTTLKGVTVISQSETPGLGSRITGDDFLASFTGINTSDVALSKDGGEVDAITGATISSRAVVNAVVDAISEKVQLLGGSE